MRLLTVLMLCLAVLTRLGGSVLIAACAILFVVGTDADVKWAELVAFGVGAIVVGGFMEWVLEQVRKTS